MRRWLFGPVAHGYRAWMNRWENELCFRANDRIIRPFEFGLEWASNWPCTTEALSPSADPIEFLKQLNRRAIASSQDFFGYESPADFTVSGDWLEFTSPVATPYPENNRVRARWFPARNANGKAVVVLPHWNSKLPQHNALCAGLQRLGISALRLSLPYHDARMPPDLSRADYAVSSNICRTIDATRQAVIDARSCVDWLEAEGYDRIAIVGTSLGSCYAFLAATHDPRIRINVFNHCSAWFSDVVWTGLSTRHIRATLEQHLDPDRLRAVWRAFSPSSYIDRFAAQKQKSLFLFTVYDSTYLPEFSREVLNQIGRTGVDHKLVVLPCGHYTLGEFPFKYVAGYRICSFLKRNL